MTQDRAELLTLSTCASALALRELKMLVEKNLMSDPTGEMSKHEVMDMFTGTEGSILNLLVVLLNTEQNGKVREILASTHSALKGGT